jgi:hypothetical protein
MMMLMLRCCCETGMDIQFVVQLIVGVFEIYFFAATNENPMDQINIFVFVCPAAGTQSRKRL